MAAGMNELLTAPLLASQRHSPDWEESINAITRHVIEEFSNLQHFVPYLFERCTLLGTWTLAWDVQVSWLLGCLHAVWVPNCSCAVYESTHTYGK